MNLINVIYVIYYVDLEDNTKGCLCAIPELDDSKETRKFIANEFTRVFDSIVDYAAPKGAEVAEGILKKGEAEVDEYAFGVEAVPLLEES